MDSVFLFPRRFFPAQHKQLHAKMRSNIMNQAESTSKLHTSFCTGILKSVSKSF